MKIIFQLLFTPIILALSIWLFTLIPTPSNMTPHYGVLGLVVYPLALAFYVSALGILGISTWNFIAFIFKEEEHEEDYKQKSVTPTVSKKKKYNYQPSLKEQTKNLNIATQITANEPRPKYKKYNYQSRLKQQIQSLNTAAQLSGLAPARPTSTKKRSDSLLFSTFKISSIIVGISFALAFAVLAFFTYIFIPDNDKLYERESKAYKTFYKTEDYNDSRIIAYKHALEDASKQLIDSENIYDTFEADMKRQIALQCIENFIKEHNTTKKHERDTQLYHFKRNARNHYARTEKLIKKSMKSEKFLQKINNIISIPNDGYYLTSPDVGIENSCKNELPVDVIYKKFMPFYIKGQESKLDNLRIRAITDYSVKKYHKRQKKWLQTLHEKYPK